jgi:hypothetical protein
MVTLLSYFSIFHTESKAAGPRFTSFVAVRARPSPSPFKTI